MARPRSLIFGVGINDLPYNVAVRNKEGKQVLCPYYASWRRMFRRCYSVADQSKHPTYNNCSVSNEWIKATDFKDWMTNQNWEGLHLDKDILDPNNKIYGPLVCAFVPQRINKLLLIRNNDRGDYPLGVSLRSNPKGHIFSKPLVAQMTNFDDNVRCLGYFKTAREAHKAWQWAKAAEIERAVTWYSSQNCFRSDVAESLLSRAWKLRLQHAQNEETITL